MKIGTLLSLKKIQLIEKLASQHDLKNIRFHLPIVGNEKQAINLLVDLNDEKTDLNQVDFLQFELSEQLGYLVRVKTSMHYPLHDYEQRQSKAVNISDHDKLQKLFKQDDYELEQWQNPMPLKNEGNHFERLTFQDSINHPPAALPFFFPSNKRSFSAIDKPASINAEEAIDNDKKSNRLEKLLSDIETLGLEEIEQILVHLKEREQALLTASKKIKLS